MGEIKKWADEAMFDAEPMPQGISVNLLEMSSDPLGQIAAACMMYEGKVIRSLKDVTRADREHYFEQVRKTKLKAPFEFVKFHFMVEGVDRAFTHQMVRQRTAVYAQESLRFAVKDNLDAETPLPPSLAGLKDDDPRVVVWRKTINNVQDGYSALVDAGVPAEDARGLLPHAVTTRLHYSTDLRALQDHAGNRLCTQAQFHWRMVFAQIAQAIRLYNPYQHAIDCAANMNDPQAEELLWMIYETEKWQYELLSQLFQPVCYLTGKCEFKAKFDRKCSIRSRVDASEEVGRPSTYWDRVWLGNTNGLPAAEETEPGVIRNSDNSVRRIAPIFPEEWLLDPTAAR